MYSGTSKCRTLYILKIITLDVMHFNSAVFVLYMYIVRLSSFFEILNSIDYSLLINNICISLLNSVGAPSTINFIS